MLFRVFTRSGSVDIAWAHHADTLRSAGDSIRADSETGTKWLRCRARSGVQILSNL